MSTILDPLVQSPRLPLYVERLRSIVEDEQQRRAEFYRTVREGEHVEFINGHVVYQSPVKNRHTIAAKHLLVVLDAYVRRFSLGFVGFEPQMISLSRNDYEPDISFWESSKAASFEPDQMRFPAPDLIVEVLSPGTEQIDRGVKFEDYAAHGVGEYWIVDPESETVEQYLLHGEQYALNIKARTGTITSAVVKGFEIPIRAIFDPAENLAALQRMMSMSPNS